MDINSDSNNGLLLSIFLYVQLGDEEKVDKTLFILSAQQYHPIEILIVVDGFLDSDNNEPFQSILKRWNAYFLRLTLVPPCKSFDQFWTIDQLLPYCQGQYLTFLAAGQKIYPHLYSSLIEGLKNSPHKTWAYSDVVMVHCNQFNQVNRRWTPFLQESYALADHLLLDYIPIQSVIFDRLKAAKLRNCNFQFRRQYHHEILLHLAQDSPPLHLAIIGVEELSPYAVNQDNSHITKEIADRYTLDHSYKANAIEDREQLVKYKKRYLFLNTEFHSQLQKYELFHNPDSFYFRRKLKGYYESLSWRITQPLRNVFRKIQGLPVEENIIPLCEIEALDRIIGLNTSTSWRLTKTLRMGILYFKKSRSSIRKV